MSYTNFQSKESSEKVTIALVNGSRRLIYVDVSPYTIYVDTKKIIKITVDGQEYSNRDISLESTNSYLYNKETKQLSLYPPAGFDLRKAFISLTERFYFSTKPLALPHDLDTGYDVFFEPHIKSTSTFENSLDVDNQQTDVIEGDGTITFLNDFDFWKKNYDKISFDNQLVEIYSWSPSIPIQDAKIIYRGNVYSRSYSENEIKLNIKNILYGLRGTLEQKDIKSLGSDKTDPALGDAKRRTVYGRLEGHRPINLDKAVNNRYKLEGTITLNNGSNIVIGNGTMFKSRLLPNDKIYVAGQEFTILDVNSDTDLVLTSPNNGRSDSFLEYYIQSPVNKRYINRNWLIAGHSLHESSYIVQSGSSSNKLILNNTRSLAIGDILRVQSNELNKIEYVEIKKIINSKIITLANSLSFIPTGLEIKRMAISDVRMGDLKLNYGEDYFVDPIGATLSIFNTAEEKRSNLYQSLEKVTVNNGDNFLTGVGTKFSSYLKVGDLVKPKGTDEFYTLYKVEDEKLTLNTLYTGTSITTEFTQSDIHTIGGLDNWKETYLISVPPEIYPEIFAGGYFWFSDADGTVAVWYSWNNILPEPAHGCDRSIKVSALFRITDRYEFINRTVQAINLDGKFKATAFATYFTVQNKEIGPRMPIKSNDGFTVKHLSYDQFEITCIPDVGNSLMGKSVILRNYYPNFNDRLRPKKDHFWFRVGGFGSPPSMESWDVAWTVEISIDSTATQVRDAIISKINSNPNYRGTAVAKNSNTLTVTMEAPISSSIATFATFASIDQINDQVSDFGYFTTGKQKIGRGTYQLHNKWFSLPYYAGSSVVKGYYFDINDQGIGVPGDIVGVTPVLIDTINHDMNEKEFFDILGDSIKNSIGGTVFNVNKTDNSITITTIEEIAISTNFSKGTSDLNISKTQAGAGTGGVSGVPIQYKNYVFNEADILSLTVYGKTDNGFSNGVLLNKAPEIVKDILINVVGSDYIDNASFTEANSNITNELSFAIPEKYNDKNSPNYRDVINKVNKSVMGMLLQTNDYKFSYGQLKPSAEVSARFDQTDIISFRSNSSNKNLVKSVYTNYKRKEFDYNSKIETSKQVFKTSDVSTYQHELTKTITLDTYLLNQEDAQRLSDRWSFILENGQNSFTIRTKLQGVLLQNNDIIKISHPKLQERIGSGDGDKLMMIESIGKKGDEVEITCIDLSAAFNRCAKISNLTLDYSSATDSDKLIGGFYKDEFGLIGNDVETFYTNLIW